MEENNVQDKSIVWNKKAPATIFGVLLFAVLGSALYDYIVKPGINIFSEKLFNYLTFGSQKIKDFSFSNAALDPSSTPSLILLTIVLVLYLFVPYQRNILRKLRKNMIKKENFTKGKIFFLKYILLPILIVIQFSLIFIPLTVFNQSVLIWRTFHTNIDIIASVSNEKTILKLKSDFASMYTESDYNTIYIEMEQIANSNNIKLRDERPW